ncbi:MAG: 30S ribosomal protein S2 [Verrucomicrobiae bacterium]|nr:30S ribosomal protein S2 [Verrucomicrobiae bacterium]
MAETISVKELFEAGVHFGHRTQRWNPKMKPFIFEARHGIYLINLDETQRQIERAAKFLERLAADGDTILFVGCKKPAQAVIKEIAGQLDCPYVADRWLGGTLTNLATIRKSVGKLDHIDELEKSGAIEKFPKQEAAKMRRVKQKLIRNLQGIRKMEKLPACAIIVDVTRELNAVAETKRLGIPVVGIVDTNGDPSIPDFPIAANDDAIRAIRAVLGALGAAIARGKGVSLVPSAPPEAVSSMDAVAG